MTRTILAAIALSTVATFANAYDAEATAPLGGPVIAQAQSDRFVDVGAPTKVQNGQVPAPQSY